MLSPRWRASLRNRCRASEVKFPAVVKSALPASNLASAMALFWKIWYGLPPQVNLEVVVWLTCVARRKPGLQPPHTESQIELEGAWYGGSSHGDYQVEWLAGCNDCSGKPIGTN